MKGKSENRSASDSAVISLFGKFLTFVGRTMYLGRFGTANVLINAFTFALNVPNVIFTVVGTALSTVMIPVYNSLLAEEKRDEAKKFIDNVISISLVLLGILVVAGIAAAPLIARLMEGGEFENPAYLAFAMRALMPVMIFFGFGAIFTGLLQSHGHFRLPAFVSAPGGIILIGYIIFFGDKFGVNGLIFATALGIFIQPLIMLPVVWRLGYRYKFSFDLKNESVRAAGKLCIPVLISVASYQVHFLFSHSIALRLNAAAVIDYSQQLVQVFILTIVYAIAAVYFPKLSVLWANADAENYNESVRSAFLFTLFLVLPAALGFFLLRFEIMGFLLNQGGNSRSDMRIAGHMMGLYSIGVIAVAIKEVADRAFYAKKDSKTPAIFGVVIMATGIALLVFFNGIYWIPAAYVLSAVIGVIGLIFTLNRKIKFINLSFLFETLKIIIAAATMLFVAFFAQTLREGKRKDLQINEYGIIDLLLPALIGAAVYIAVSFILKIKAVRAVFK